jgi:hypothetical protein
LYQGPDDGDLISFHANLARSEGLQGDLRLDGDTTFDVTVSDGWLAVQPQTRCG